MKRPHAITPTDTTPPPNPDWRYSPPQVSVDGRIVVLDAFQCVTLPAERQAQVDAANATLRGWGRK